MKEILARADVGRSAFYAHFHDKDALLTSGIHHILHAAPLRHMPPSTKRFGRALWFSLPILEFIDQCRHSAHMRMDRKGWTLIHEHLRQVLIGELADNINAAMRFEQANERGMPADLAVEYVVTTFILVLNWWVETRSTLSPREVDDLFLSMVVPALAATSEGT